MRHESTMEGRKPAIPQRVDIYDIHRVHVLIEHCLLRNMDALQTETALEEFGVARCFTRIVWQELERSNPEYFTGSPLTLQASLERRKEQQMASLHPVQYAAHGY